MIFRAAARTKTERLVSTMKKTYKIEVDCANCAQKMEDAANTVAGVEKATVSFMTQKMKVEVAEGADGECAVRLQEGGGRLRDL